MLTRTFAAAAVAALALSPALAQTTDQKTTKEAPAASVSQPHNQSDMRFLQQQANSEWRSSKLVGTSVTGSNNQNIGEINDLLVDSSGTVKAVVVGVGGFLGVGEKDVAIPFNAIKITRKSGDDAIDKITVSYTKQQLNDAPSFKYLADADNTGSARQSTGSGPAAPDNKR
jgi:hypothetical protein